jgi:hypothetical protein
MDLYSPINEETEEAVSGEQSREHRRHKMQDVVSRGGIGTYPCECTFAC